MPLSVVSIAWIVIAPLPRGVGIAKFPRLEQADEWRQLLAPVSMSPWPRDLWCRGLVDFYCYLKKLHYPSNYGVGSELFISLFLQYMPGCSW